jgi:hypothetical protein
VSTYNVTLPLGVSARLNLTDANPQMHLLEAAVSG